MMNLFLTRLRMNLKNDDKDTANISLEKFQFSLTWQTQAKHFVVASKIFHAFVDIVNDTWQRWWNI